MATSELENLKWWPKFKGFAFLVGFGCRWLPLGCNQFLDHKWCNEDNPIKDGSQEHLNDINQERSKNSYEVN
jgi:hypothetical protein